MANPSGLKTWSALGELRRKPSEYDIVTYDLHYHAKRKPPFELSPEAPLNQWYGRYRDGSLFQASDWNRFRDPAQMVYRKYNLIQDEQETYLDELFDEFERLGHDARLGRPWLNFLRRAWGPWRFAGHGLQMTAAYLGQIAPSSSISNCAFFQAADELRRVQRSAYRLKQLDLAYPEQGFGRDDRAIWEQDPHWQPLRELIERLLVAYDWGECFTALQLVVKLMVDELSLVQMGELARANRDDLLAMFNDNLFLDSARSREWAAALTAYALGEQPENGKLLRDWVAKWRPLARRAVDTFAVLFETGLDQPLAHDRVSREVADAHDAFLAGLTL